MTKALNALNEAKGLLVSAHVATALIWKRYDCVAAIDDAITDLEQPDCRLCARSWQDTDGLACVASCTDGDNFEPSEPVRLYK